MANFNKGREIDLIKYVPDVLADVDEYKAIMTLETKSKKDQWAILEKLFDSQYILEAGEFGISLFEKMHDVMKLDTDTLQFRRNRIYQLYNDKPPFTRQWLKASLDSMRAGCKYSYDIDTEKFTFTIYFEGVTTQVLNQVYLWLEKILPYNMLISNVYLQKTSTTTRTATYIRSTKKIKVKAWQDINIELNESKFLSACCCRSERKMRIKAIPLDS